MGILSRFKAIMSSNWNALVDKAENPEQTIDDFMRGLNRDLGQVRAETTAMLAEERRAKRALDENAAEIRKLEKYAAKSVEDGNEEAAARFLERKGPLSGKEAELRSAYEAAAAQAAGLKQMQDKMVADLEQLEARRISLKEKLAAVQNLQSRSRPGSPLNGGHEAAFKAAEAKANDAYYEALALAELRGEGKKDDVDELFAEFERGLQNKAQEESKQDGPQ